jgi:uncharacterized protein (TIGR02172 family)
MENGIVQKKGKLLGKGMTSEVYEWGRNRVLKLYYEKFSDKWIRREVEIGSAVFESGVSAPAIFDTVVVDGRKGIIFQRISGKSMLKHIDAEPWKLECFSKRMAGFHFNIHKCSSEGLPTQKERFEFTINKTNNIPEQKKKRILEYLYSLPDGVSVCHGDLHFDNIIVSNQNLVAIDWTNAYRGNPLGDVARTCLMINSPTIPSGFSDKMIKPYLFAKKMTYWAYLNEYMRLANVDFKKIDEWMLPVAAARIREKIPGEQKWLMNIINMHLIINNG